MLKELHEITMRIEKVSRADHDLIRDVHPKVREIKEHVENVVEAVSPGGSGEEIAFPVNAAPAVGRHRLCKQNRTAVL